MSEKEALKLASRALSASGQRDAASGNGMDLAVITKDGYRALTDAEVNSLLK
jgi:proteasome beta subunit